MSEQSGNIQQHSAINDYGLIAWSILARPNQIHADAALTMKRISSMLSTASDLGFSKCQYLSPQDFLKLQNDIAGLQLRGMKWLQTANAKLSYFMFFKRDQR